MIRKKIKNNSSLLLSVGAGVGVLSTAYLAAKAGYRTAHKLEDKDPYMDLKERTRLVWKFYIPAGAAATATIVCVAGIKHVDARKTLAAQTALAVSQRAYESYREQVVQELGEKKDQLFLSKVAEKEVSEKPPSKSIIAGSGEVLCCELWTMRYFKSDMQSLKRAENEINAKLVRHDYATLDDLYYLIDLDPTPSSSQSGWEASRLFEFEFSSILHNDQPCLAFGYNYVKSL